MKKKICFITGSRAEYGVISNLLKLFLFDSDVSLSLIVTGSHLSQEFGMTSNEIEKDGFILYEKLEMLLSSDTNESISKSMGLIYISLPDIYRKIAPDCVVVTGDRFEMFACASVANIMNIPVVHLYGGELTSGSIDDSLRHSISKMSLLHFTSTEEYKKRVIQLGENPDFVFNIGALGVENIKNEKLEKKTELEKKLNIKFCKKNLLVAFHSETIRENTSEKYFKEILKAISKMDETLIIFSKTNSDTDGRVINSMMDDYVSKNNNSVVFTSMGKLNFLSTMKQVDFIIGNSSSGIIEAPSFKIATINIGERQKGRIRAESVIDCFPNDSSITNSINLVYTEHFINLLKTVKNPFYKKNTSINIRNIIKTFDFNLKKEFYDVSFTY